MLRFAPCLAVALLIAGSLHTAVAQTSAPATSTEPKPSKIKLTAERLKDMKTKWSTNKAKLKVCRADVKAKGLTGDDRWFYIDDSMGKS
jgi:hypothetical protein